MPFRNLRRGLSILRVLTRHGVAHLCGPGWSFPGCPPGNLSGPERLFALLSELGGTFVKFGQMMALQPDILPRAYCDILMDLLDRMPSVAYDQVDATFAEENGCKLTDVFDYVDPDPLASASIAQVHLGALDGKRYAIKIQRSGAGADFAGDIRLMTVAAGVIHILRLRSLYWVADLTNEFIAWTREELDFRTEARYMDQIRRNAGNNLRERVPELISEYTSRRTLIVEYLEGMTVSDYLRAQQQGRDDLLSQLEADGFEAPEYAGNIIENFFNDVFRDGIFHADLHPANLVIMPDNVVGYVDFGISGVLSTFARRKMVAMTLACTAADVDAMCEAFLDISVVDRRSDVRGFRQGLEDFAPAWFGEIDGRASMRTNFTLIMLDMVKVSRRTNIWPDRDVVKYLRSSVAIDGLITRLAPEFDVGERVRAITARHLKWEARQAMFNEASLVDWTSASARLLQDGPQRAVGILNRISQDTPGSGNQGRMATDEDGRLRQRALLLALTILAVACLIAARGAPVGFGFNSFTAHITVGFGAIFMLMHTLGQLLRHSTDNAGDTG